MSVVNGALVSKLNQISYQHLNIYGLYCHENSYKQSWSQNLTSTDFSFSVTKLILLVQSEMFQQLLDGLR